MAERTAVVAGGGIGGLAVAVALRARGWRVRVLERAPELGEVGAGLSLWPNGMRALDAIGLGDAVRHLALRDAQAGIRDTRGRWLTRTDTAEMERRYGSVVILHRAEFLEILRQAAPELHTGTTVTAVDTNADRVRVEYTSGGGQATDASESPERTAAAVSAGGVGVIEADLLVGADGINSVVRRAVWPGAPAPRYAGYTGWRVVVDGVPLTSGGETWGRGERVGFSPLAGGRAYLYAAASVPAGGRSADGELAEMRRRFGGWHEPIPQLLAAAEEGAVLRHDIYDLPPLAEFAVGRVALVGDAAHAMTPDLGQGANQALEDAVTLAELLDTPGGLAAYDRVRRVRTRMICRRSRRVGAVAQGRTLPALRNLVLRLTPSSAVLNSLAPVVSWRPGAPGSGR